MDGDIFWQVRACVLMMWVELAILHIQRDSGEKLLDSSNTR